MSPSRELKSRAACPSVFMRPGFQGMNSGTDSSSSLALAAARGGQLNGGYVSSGATCSMNRLMLRPLFRRVTVRRETAG